MFVTQLALLRHGMTDWNLEKRIQGRTDRPLGQDGRRQLSALAVPDRYRASQWYCSPLRRARETADLLELEYRVETALIEMHWGEWEGKVLKPLRKPLSQKW